MARAENKLSEAVFLIAEGVNISIADDLTQNMLFDIEDFLPECFLKNKIHHGNSVYSAVFSLDGKQVLTASGDRTARLWDATSGKQIGTDIKHEGVVYSAVFSPDGKQVVTASSDRTARLLNAASGKQIGTDIKHEHVVHSAVFSPDGKLVLTASEDKTARLWDAAAGKQMGPDMKHEGVVFRAVFSLMENGFSQQVVIVQPAFGMQQPANKWAPI
jgi:WD40 repeat protein